MRNQLRILEREQQQQQLRTCQGEHGSRAAAEGGWQQQGESPQGQIMNSATRQTSAMAPVIDIPQKGKGREGKGREGKKGKGSIAAPAYGDS
eukprot:1159502-Pelagomonas_calceolata.AAC.19